MFDKREDAVSPVIAVVLLLLLGGVIVGIAGYTVLSNVDNILINDVKTVSVTVQISGNDVAVYPVSGKDLASLEYYTVYFLGENEKDDSEPIKSTDTTSGKVYIPYPENKNIVIFKDVFEKDKTHYINIVGHFADGSEAVILMGKIDNGLVVVPVDNYGGSDPSLPSAGGSVVPSSPVDEDEGDYYGKGSNPDGGGNGFGSTSELVSSINTEIGHTVVFNSANGGIGFLEELIISQPIIINGFTLHLTTGDPFNEVDDTKWLTTAKITRAPTFTDGPLIIIKNNGMLTSGGVKLILDGNGVETNSPLIVIESGTLDTKNGLDLINNKNLIVSGDYGGKGGAIYNMGTLTLTSGGGNNIYGNSAVYGAGIYNEGTTTGSITIRDNTATQDGGGVYNMGTVTLTSGGNNIYGNRAVNGAGIYNKGTTECSATIRDNIATQDGGGVYNTGDKSNTYTGPISDNNAKNGAGIYNEGTITCSATIHDNTATQDGGGVYNTGDKSNSYTGPISDNNAKNGAGIYNTGIIQIGANINTNTATENGGGIYNGGSINMGYGNIFSNNAKNGAGIYNTGIIQIGANINTNTATENGGGIYNSGSFNMNYGPISTSNSAKKGSVYYAEAGSTQNNRIYYAFSVGYNNGETLDTFQAVDIELPQYNIYYK